MPRLIDHRAREVEVAEAAWRVVVRDGVRKVSVRTVAAEAGLATASLRRAFPTQAALLAFCLGLVRERVTLRIAALPSDGDVVVVATRILRELLPSDTARRTEMEVFLQLGTLSLADPTLRPGYDGAHADLAALCRRFVLALRPGLDPELETARLHALVDGLALHLVRQPPAASTDWAARVLERHLAGLAPGTTAAGTTAVGTAAVGATAAGATTARGSAPG